MSQIYSTVLLQAYKKRDEYTLCTYNQSQQTLFSGENLECHLDRLVLIQIII